jgi:hypothetical protein
MAKRKGGKRSSGGSKSPRKVSRTARPLGVVARRVVVPRRVTAVVPRRVVPVARAVVPRVIPAPRVMPVAAPMRRAPLRPPIMGTGMGPPPVPPVPPVPPIGPMGPVPGMMPAGRGVPPLTTPMRGMPRAPLAPFPRGRRY